MSQTFALNRLQKTDSQIDQIEARIKQITAIVESDTTIQKAEKNIYNLKINADLAHKKTKSLEEDLKVLQIKKETSESSMYGGKIQIPKELQSLQDEIASLKKRIDILEDQIYLSMEESDRADSSKQKAESDFVKIQADFFQSRTELLEEQSQLRINKEHFEAERISILGTISDPNLEIYKQLRKQKRGIAVVKVEDGSCSACGNSFRPEEIQTTHSQNSIVLCTSCGRIVYSG